MAAINLESKNKIHFIGIGGIGVSALARMFLAAGKQVSGSDRAVSSITSALEKLGAEIKIGQAAENVPADADLVVYTIAVSLDNPELTEAKRRSLTVLSYPKALGQISRDKYTIAVAGTHGKTTTTAMIAKIMRDNGLDPTVIVGSLLNGGEINNLPTNFVDGRSKFLVVEACEYRRSFLNLVPRILVITNIDNDHLDYYRDLDDIRSAFAELVAKVPSGGKVITEGEYGEINLPIKLPLPGAHNQKNAQAAIAAALALGVAEVAARRSLADFAGTWRRFEYKGQTAAGALVYDDYGHHPTEIAATLAGAREKHPNKRIVAVFQPHLYSRTKLLLKDFAQSFADADEVIILPIYAAREAFDPAISSAMLAEKIKGHFTGKPAHLAANFAGAADYLKRTAGANDLFLLIGAGDIFQLAGALVN